jgi:cytochrome c oxidase cbb3-type subunit III
MRFAFGFGLLPITVLLLNGCGHPPVSEEDQPSKTLDFGKLYGTNCAGCHGQDGTKGPGPRIGDPLYLSFTRSENIRAVVEHGRKGTPMPAFGPSEAGPLSDKQIDALVDGLERNWSKKIDSGPALPPYSEEDSMKAGLESGNPERGHAAYLLYCAGCHGTGTGKSLVGPVATPSYVAIASNQGLRTTIVLGRPEFGMPDWRHRPPHPIANQEISDVVAWLASLRPAYSKIKPMVLVPTHLKEQNP